MSPAFPKTHKHFPSSSQPDPATTFGSTGTYLAACLKHPPLRASSTGWDNFELTQQIGLPGGFACPLLLHPPLPVPLARECLFGEPETVLTMYTQCRPTSATG